MKIGIINTIIENTTRLGAKAAFKLKKASPELLIAGGVACVIGGTVMACKATKKTDDILADANDKIQHFPTDPDALPAEDISDEDVQQIISTNKKEVAKIKLDCAGKLVANYAPSVAVGGVGIAMILASHGIMRQRNATLLAAYNAVDTAFRKYRERVMLEDGGRERDVHYMTGGVHEELIEYEEDERGELVRRVNDRAEDILLMDHPTGPYTFIFGPTTSSFWSSHGLSNLNLLRQTERWATDQIRLNGFIFVNDVLERLGMAKVPIGQLAGWAKGFGDDYVDFGLIEDYRAADVDVDVMKKPIVLNFNCDGSIWDKL